MCLCIHACKHECAHLYTCVSVCLCTGLHKTACVSNHCVHIRLCVYHGTIRHLSTYSSTLLLSSNSSEATNGMCLGMNGGCTPEYSTSTKTCHVFRKPCAIYRQRKEERTEKNRVFCCDHFHPHSTQLSAPRQGQKQCWNTRRGPATKLNPLKYTSTQWNNSYT